jgi:hypothetical protein
VKRVTHDVEGLTMPRTAEGQGFVGSWQITVFEREGPPTLALATCGADGTLVTAEHPVVTPPDAPGPIFASAGHGAWRTTGPDAAIFSTVGLGSTGQGTLFAVVTFRAAVTLGADGQTFSGEFVATVADRAGTTMATFPGTLQGTRIAAEAPAVPTAGTQAA